MVENIEASEVYSNYNLSYLIPNVTFWNMFENKQDSEDSGITSD